MAVWNVVKNFIPELDQFQLAQSGRKIFNGLAGLYVRWQTVPQGGGLVEKGKHVSIYRRIRSEKGAIVALSSCSGFLGDIFKVEVNEI